MRYDIKKQLECVSFLLGEPISVFEYGCVDNSNVIKNKYVKYYFGYNSDPKVVKQLLSYHGLYDNVGFSNLYPSNMFDVGFCSVNVNIADTETVNQDSGLLSAIAKCKLFLIFCPDYYIKINVDMPEIRCRYHFDGIQVFDSELSRCVC